MLGSKEIQLDITRILPNEQSLSSINRNSRGESLKRDETVKRCVHPAIQSKASQGWPYFAGKI